MTVEPVIALRGLVKEFRGHLGIGRHRAVRGLDLEVRRGEIFGLLGPNGAGKTTTLKMILALLRPTAGTVELFGRPPTEPAVRARVGFLPENPYFYDYLTGEEFLDFYGRLHGLPGRERGDRVRETLARVGLSGSGKVALRKYSKGMTQRLGLAQAILHDPELVVLDEPMSGLDPVGRREVRDLILARRDAGHTVFFSSHILQDAEMICDRVAILVRGRTVYVGDLDRIAERRTLWFEVGVSGQLPDSWNEHAVSSRDGETLVRVPDVEHLTRLLNDVGSTGGQVRSVWPRRESLEDVFLEKVGAGGNETEARP